MSFSYNILWGKWEAANSREHTAHIALRKQARAEGWTGVSGFREFAKERYNARLYVNGHEEITGIGFRDEATRTLFCLSIEQEHE